ncbi:hypothetical protein MASR1M42_16580 [Azonexus hydrophilus]
MENAIHVRISKLLTYKNPCRKVSNKMNMTDAADCKNFFDRANFDLIESINMKEKIATKANRETNDGGAAKNQ